MKSTAAIFLLLILCWSAGCQQRVPNMLLGRWEGRPDSADLRAEREAEKYGDEIGEAGASAADNEAERFSDWEEYDVKIVMDFVSSDRIEMTLDGAQAQSGNWQVVAQSPVGCTIEIQTAPEAQDDKIVRRRFDLLLDQRDGTCVGFQLTETGADPQLGAIYFRRPES
ncbi:MAG: hypothetical protein ACR2NM_16610 [Bythopirellula sp.]